MAEAVPDDSASATRMLPDLEGGEALSVPVGEGGGALSPLSGAYLLVVLSEPLSEAHKTRMVTKLRQGNENVNTQAAIYRKAFLPAFAENS